MADTTMRTMKNRVTAAASRNPRRGIGALAEQFDHRNSFIPRLSPSNVIGTIFPSKIFAIMAVDWL